MRGTVAGRHLLLGNRALLDAERIEALRALDRDRLLALGAHAYLVFMAGMRLKMATAPQTFERF